MQSECKIWTKCKDGFGYGLLKHKGKVVRAHRLAYAEAHGLDVFTMGGVLLHSCDNPACYNPAHLTMGTRADNNRDRDAKGRHIAFKGEEHPMALLSDEKAQYIIDNYVRGKRGQVKEFAKKFHVSVPTIYAVTSGRHFKHLRRNNER